MNNDKEELKVENNNAVELDDDVLDMVTGGAFGVSKRLSDIMVGDPDSSKMFIVQE